MFLHSWLAHTGCNLRNSAGCALAACLLASVPKTQAQQVPPPEAPHTTATPAASPAQIPYPHGEDTALGRQIAGLLAAPGVARAHWGIAVTMLDGTPLYGLDEGKLFRPASTAKLFTTAAAMAMLGPGRRFTTKVIAEGPLDAGHLRGDLVLAGGGDANFGSHNLPFHSPSPDSLGKVEQLTDIDSLADQVVAAGLKTVDGDVIGDDTYFEDTPYPEGWSIDDMLWGYGAPVSALTIHDNQLDLTITPPADRKARLQKLPVVLSPDLPYYAVNPEQPEKSWTTASGWAGGVYSQDFGQNQVAIERTPGSRRLAVFGDVATVHGPVHEQIAIDEPARYAAMALRVALERRGIRIGGGVKVRHYDSGFVGTFLKETGALPGAKTIVDRQVFDPDLETGCVDNHSMAQSSRLTPDLPTQVLAQQTSAVFAEDLRFTLKESQNLHAEIMLRNLAAVHTCEHTLRGSVQLLRAYLSYAGLNGDDFVFYDGSGLSAKDLVTPRAEAQLLAYAARQPWVAAWEAALPVGGVDGTLEHRFTEPPLKGRVFAKTGTLGESRALAGYVIAASGREVIFSVMVDNHPPAGGADRMTLDKIVAAIQALQ